MVSFGCELNWAIRFSTASVVAPKPELGSHYGDAFDPTVRWEPIMGMPFYPRTVLGSHYGDVFLSPAVLGSNYGDTFDPRPRTGTKC
jgi:hypothetical protein